jgi:hypothetical protein
VGCVIDLGGAVMHGVPANLPLQQYVGACLVFIGLGKHQIQFSFDKAPTISVEGKWELKDASGMTVDGSIDPSDRKEYRVHVVLNDDVNSFEINSPHSFSLTFSSGHELTVFDDSEQYESFSLDGFYV